MNELSNLSAILKGGDIPSGYDEKAIKKLVKTYGKLESPAVVHLYPLRTITYDDSHYCVYACPIKGAEIDEATLSQIKSEVDQLEIGEIRYDSVQSKGSDYYVIEGESGRHILTSGQEMDSVMEISDRYDGIILFSKISFSSKKAHLLDCHYALTGIKSQPNQYAIETIPNKVIGQVPTIIDFKGTEEEGEEEESPAAAKYRSAMTVLSIIIAIGLLIWYLFFK